MRRYLVEVHGTLLQTLVNLMNDYSTNLLLYKDGYYQIDGDLHTKLPGQVFTNLHSALKSSRDDLKSEIELLNTTKDKISDLVSYDGSSHTSTVMDYNFLLNQIKNLDSSITQYESNHASQDLVAFKELLAATKALITEHSGKTRTVGTYQSGDFAKLKSVKRFAIAYKQATQQMESRVERVKAAQERDKVRFEALAAEDRAKNGWKDLAIGVVTVAFGILAIIGTLGTATPLVVAGGIVGFGTTAYGLSNMYEAGQDIKLGNAGDIQTKAGNPIRDTLFMGNDKLYHDVGNVFTTASAIMIPIGQTQSVVKGLTQFAIGEASAYTAGQVAYHGTKLLGGSEEDAQTANFIGNLVGGYAASSAASKFSLNKVSNIERIKENIKESRLARESSNFKQYVAKEKSIIESWNRNTSKSKMYNMDDLANLQHTENFTKKSLIHIFEGDINRRGQAGGYHYDMVEGTSGSIIEGTKSPALNNAGFYEAKVEVNGIPKKGNEGYSTFFPDHMSPQEVVDTVNEAYETRVFNTKSRNIYEGISKNGMKITMYLDSENKIISAFPSSE